LKFKPKTLKSTHTLQQAIKKSWKMLNHTDGYGVTLAPVCASKEGARPKDVAQKQYLKHFFYRYI
jgi:hypothetical protein